MTPMSPRGYVSVQLSRLLPPLVQAVPAGHARANVAAGRSVQQHQRVGQFALVVALMGQGLREPLSRRCDGGA